MTNVRHDLWDEPAQPDAMSWPPGEVTRVASPKRHGELLLEAERVVRRSEWRRALADAWFYTRTLIGTLLVIGACWAIFLTGCWLVTQ